MYHTDNIQLTGDDEYFRQLNEWLPRRMFFLLLTYGILIGIDLIWFSTTTLPGSLSAIPGAMWVRILAYPLSVLVILYEIFRRLPEISTREKGLSAVTEAMIVLGSVAVVSRFLLQRQLPQPTVDYAIWSLADLFLLHIVACVYLPWTPRESSRPMIPLLLIWAVCLLAASPDRTSLSVGHLVAIMLSWLILAPGWGLAAWRMSRHRERFELLRLDRQMSSLGGELVRARMVHDSMFPRPYDDGHIRFEYEYNPIAEIGGDYVHLHHCEQSQCLTVTLLDVAGHGLAAALTVNRLFGEIERIRGENANAEPEEVIALLNRYINLTMAKHDLYATGACMMLDPHSGQLRWVSAGHPPIFLRRGDGSLSDLHSTTVLMGALPAAEFEPNQQITRLAPGDIALAYTDGAFEARNADGSRFGLDALRQTAGFDPPPRSWPKFLSTAVTKHHQGHADDDVLIASLCLKSLRVPAPVHQQQEAVVL